MVEHSSAAAAAAAGAAAAGAAAAAAAEAWAQPQAAARACSHLAKVVLDTASFYKTHSSAADHGLREMIPNSHHLVQQLSGESAQRVRTPSTMRHGLLDVV
jgi:hypothetical protein